MLTRIFATSKPLNYLLVSGYVFLVFALEYVLSPDLGVELLDILSNALAVAALIFSILLVDFIVRKNRLSKTNTFIILCYGLLMALLPLTKTVWAFLGAQLFLLFALRRLMSLGSQKRVIKKMYDAGLWIAVASLFNFWAGLFIIGTFLALLYFAKPNYRYWLLPFFGMATVLLLYATGYWMYMGYLPAWNNWYQLPNLNFSTPLNQETYLVPFVFLALSLLSGILFYVKLRKTLFKFKKVQMYCLALLLLTVTIVIVGPGEQSEGWLLLSFPLAVVMGNVVQHNKHRLITEILLWVLLLSPFVMRMLL